MALVSKTDLIRLQKSLGTDAAIAAKFKVTRQAIQQLRRNYGIESRYTRNPKRNKEILSLFKNGKRPADLAKKFGLSVAHIYLLIGKSRGRKS